MSPFLLECQVRGLACALPSIHLDIHPPTHLTCIPVRLRLVYPVQDVSAAITSRLPARLTLVSPVWVEWFTCILPSAVLLPSSQPSSLPDSLIFTCHFSSPACSTGTLRRLSWTSYSAHPHTLGSCHSCKYRISSPLLPFWLILILWHAGRILTVIIWCDCCFWR